MNQTHQNTKASPSVCFGVTVLEIITWFIAWLPAKLGLAAGAALGRLVFYLSAPRRRIAISNIEMIKKNGSLPTDLNAVATAKEAFANIGRAGWEALCLYHRGLGVLGKDCFLDSGEENLDLALKESAASGRGLVMVTGHIGSWEVMVHNLTQAHNFQLNIIGRLTGNPIIDTFVLRLRTKGNNRFISKDGGAREMLKVLRNGGHIGTLIDQADIGSVHETLIPFLGREAATNVGPIRLAQRMGTPILMILFWRVGSHKYYKFMPLVYSPAGLEGEEAILAVARQLNDMLSSHIQKFPDQWMWGHRRWKTRQGIKADPQSIT